MKLSDLPHDLLLCIADYLPRRRDIAHLARAYRNASVSLRHYLLWRSRDIILLIAASQGNDDLLRRALECRLDVNRPEPVAENTPLSLATRYRHLSTIKILLAVDGIDLFTRDTESGHTPLQWAVKANDFEAMRLLLSHPSMNTEAVGDALVLAINQNQVEAAQVCMSFDIDLNAMYDGKTPLAHAAKRPVKTIRNMLLDDERVNLDCMCSQATEFGFYEGGVPIMLVLMDKAFSSEELSYLLGKRTRYNLEVRDATGKNALHIMAQQGYLAGCRILLDEFPHFLTQKDRNQQTPFFYAVVGEHLDICLLFLEQSSVDYGIQNEKGRLLLHECGLSGDLHLLQAIQHKTGTSQFSLRDRDGFPP
ncbi:ankyrin [Penicillium macrosclerotiorum]|uniref:ankyrin n=1 Tax=Penicillium macrosclerotiorum TaxID=303699 RepID=UPI002547D6B7|nr:ankyrin [Penicillium macrosclerotiorum]KAJ5698307.1 ankyrin [Penicillium macrosclerotiorum]